MEMMPKEEEKSEKNCDARITSELLGFWTLSIIQYSTT
jgi:hypothetical protein